MDDQAAAEASNKVGRPSVMSEGVVKKLVQAFQSGLNITLACQYAKISRQDFYNNYNRDGEFFDKIEDAKLYFLLAAGNRVSGILIRGSDRDAGPMARWVMERKMPEEWGPPTNQTQVNVLNNISYVPPSWSKHTKEVGDAPDRPAAAEPVGE